MPELNAFEEVLYAFMQLTGEQNLAFQREMPSLYQALDFMVEEETPPWLKVERRQTAAKLRSVRHMRFPSGEPLCSNSPSAVDELGNCLLCVYRAKELNGDISNISSDPAVATSTIKHIYHAVSDQGNSLCDGQHLLSASWSLTNENDLVNCKYCREIIAEDRLRNGI